MTLVEEQIHGKFGKILLTVWKKNIEIKKIIKVRKYQLVKRQKHFYALIYLSILQDFAKMKKYKRGLVGYTTNKTYMYLVKVNSVLEKSYTL